MVKVTNLGFPRMGANRELKKLVENYWARKIDESALLAGAQSLRRSHWELQASAGVSQGHIPSNDFSLYDHMLDTAFMFGVIPPRYKVIKSKLDQYFAMGRGHQKDGIDVPAQEMKKWFDTNYHFIVPEFSAETDFSLYTTKPLDEFKEALALGIKTRPVLVGPVSFLALGKAANNVHSGFDPLELLDKLIPVYVTLLTQLQEAGAEWIQMDEPILSLDADCELKHHVNNAYSTLGQSVSGLKIMLTSYFDSISDNFDMLVGLPIAGIHVDLVRAPQDLALITSLPHDMVISLGLVNGRNIWINDLIESRDLIVSVVKSLGSDRVFVAPSCSLLHCPHSLEAEVDLNPTIKSWMSFAVEKLDELATISTASTNTVTVNDKLSRSAQLIQSRRVSELIHDVNVQNEMKSLSPEFFQRKSPYSVRAEKQEHKLHLPLLPTTTVGSFPQTKEVRVIRNKLKKGEISQEEYDAFIKQQMKDCVKMQEEVGLDMLVHGEFERNDMVEFFGEHLKGYTFTKNGWVQSYGSRCVKPPVIYGDVSRPTAMTVKDSVYAQSLTTKPMKGMLTGPVTMLQWSFVRDDQPRRDTAFQIALALRKEVCDLESAGLPAIQIDEPAIREGLPLKAKDQATYLKWAVEAFLLSSTGVSDETQIHTHMCYSDFNDIFPAIQALDADCITIENSKSDLKLLSAFEKFGYSAGIGPGLYDIHSPRVPSVKEMKYRLQEISKFIQIRDLWVNPDCGLKTRGWAETRAALENMVQVAKEMRLSLIG